MEINPIIENIQSILNNIEDRQNCENFKILLSFDWEKEYYRMIFTTGVDEEPIEDLGSIETTKSRKHYLRSIIFDLKILAVANPYLSIKVFDVKEPNILLLKTESCPSVREKVLDLKPQCSSILFPVIFNHEGCEVEVYFYTYEEGTNHNLLLTTCYNNPVAVDEMETKLDRASKDHPLMYTIGFIGVFSNDHYLKVKQCIEKVFQALLVRVNLIERQAQEAEEIEKMNDAEIMEHLFRGFPKKDEELLKPVKTGRMLRSRRANELVDLTEEETHEEDDDISSTDFYIHCCSEILIYDLNKSLGCSGWDDLVNEKLLIKPVNNEEFFNFWLSTEDFESGENESSLINIPMEIDDNSDHEHDSQNQTHSLSNTSSDEKKRYSRRMDEGTSSQTMTFHTNHTNAREITQRRAYNEKPANDRGESSSSSTSKGLGGPQIGRGLDPRGLVFLKDKGWENDKKKKFPKSQLLDQADFHNLSSRRTSPTIPKFSNGNHSTKGRSPTRESLFRIPKKDRSPIRGPSGSIIAPSPQPRRAINKRSILPGNPRIRSESEKTRGMLMLEKAFANLKENKDATSPESPHNFIVAPRQMPPESVSIFIDGDKSDSDDDVIAIDDDNDVEMVAKNSDMNNNGKGRRKLYTPEEYEKPIEISNRGPNRIFKSKTKHK